MAHGGYARRRIEERRPLSRRSKGAGLDKKRKKPKFVSLKNQIRSTERLLRKDLPNEAREAQEKKLEELRRQQDIHSRLAVERTIQLRDRKIKFFERRKIERMIRRLEKQQRSSSDHLSEGQITGQLSKLREDLEYVRFFPKNEKYVSLFTGGENQDLIEKRNKWRKQIKDNLIEAAASGKDLEETASDDDALDMSEDDFFMSASSSDEEADDEWTDKSTKEQASSASGKATSGMSSDERNQRQKSARVLMPPPRSLPPNNRIRSNNHNNINNEKRGLSTSDNTSASTSGTHLSSSSKVKMRRVGGRDRNSSSSNLSSISDAHNNNDNKPRRKRRHRKKKKQA